MSQMAVPWSSSTVPNGLQRWTNIGEQAKRERNCWRHTKHSAIRRSARDCDRTFSRHILLLKHPGCARFSVFNNDTAKVRKWREEKAHSLHYTIIRIKNLFYSLCIHYSSVKYFAFPQPTEASLVEFHVRVSWLLVCLYLSKYNKLHRILSQSYHNYKINVSFHH